MLSLIHSRWNSLQSDSTILCPSKSLEYCLVIDKLWNIPGRNYPQQGVSNASRRCWLWEAWTYG